MTTRRPSILFFHAHPDDEAIFTGGTLALLTDRGVAVTVVIATDDASATTRRLEAEEAAAVLKVDRLEFLGYPDSGLGNRLRPGCFALVDTEVAGGRLAAIADEVQAQALVTYDSGGIYGHPDHLAVHRVGHRAAVMASVGTCYEATVDREHLHFVDTHLVGGAVDSLLRVGREEGGVSVPSPDGKLTGGLPTVMIDSVVDVTAVTDRKRAAMAAHASQIPAQAEVLNLDAATFAAVYGQEWYRRIGPRTVLDELS